MRRLFVVMCIFMPTYLFAMADNGPYVYGRPTLYGEYEITSDRARQSAAMYGPQTQPRPIAVDVSAVGEKRSQRPPKARRHASAKKSAKKNVKTPQVPQEKEKASVTDVIVVPPRVVVVPKDNPKTDHRAREYAAAIVRALDWRDVDSFCEKRGLKPGIHPRGGVVIMPGRPDLMSCIEK